MIIDFRITNQTLKCISKYNAAEGTENYIKLRFVFSEDWNGMTKTLLVQCCGEDGPLMICLDSDDCCYVPGYLSGVCRMSLTGTDGDITITTGIVSVCFEKTLSAADGARLENSSNDFSELIGKISQKADKADIEAIKNTLSGVYQNKGDITEMTLTLPPDDKEILNNVYNVKAGYVSSGEYGKSGAFKYKINIPEAYFTEADHSLCFKLSDIPQCLWRMSESGFVFNDGLAKVAFCPNNNASNCWTFSCADIIMPIGNITETIAELSLSGITGTPAEVYFADKVFVDGKYSLGEIETIWYRSDIKTDDNFVITENGFDVLSYRLTDYVSKANFEELSKSVGDSKDVLTELKEKTMLVNEISGSPVIGLTDVLAGEGFVKCNIYGTEDEFGNESTSTGKYSVILRNTNKNLLYKLIKNARYGMEVIQNDDGSVAASGTATKDVYFARYNVGNLPSGEYHLSGCPKGGSTDTYFISTSNSASDTEAFVDTGNGVTFQWNDTTRNTFIYVWAKKGAVLDNVVFKPQLEVGNTGTEYVQGKRNDITITLSEALGAGEYIDIPNRKRYGVDGASEVEITGDIKPVSDGENILYCPMSTAPTKITAAYYKNVKADVILLNNRLNSVYTKEETDKAIEDAIKAYASRTEQGGADE